MEVRDYRLLNLLKCAIWNNGNCEVDEYVFNEACRHTVEVLPADLLPQLELNDDLRKKWQIAIYKRLLYNESYKYAEKNLPITVPYIILKGSAAAKYYPHPEYRAMGDIDIMTRREDYETSCDELLSAGYREKISKEIDRHREFEKNNIDIENHYFFASLNDLQEAEYLDNLIVNNIGEGHELPDMVNGLVLLEHINQHLENGLGLRQILDWMMFVDQCLSDDKWPEFEPLSVKIGLKNLAIVVTRMCEIYLGLPERKWCSEANESLCSQLMDYVLDSGNFGNKRYDDKNKSTSEDFFSSALTPKAAISYLQKRGLANWEAAQKHRFLQPFAWIYQVFRYLKRGIDQQNAPQKLRDEYKTAKQRVELFDALGVKRRAKGIVKYEDGKYVK